MGACVSTNNLLAGEMQRTRVFFWRVRPCLLFVAAESIVLGGKYQGEKQNGGGIQGQISRCGFPTADFTTVCKNRVPFGVIQPTRVFEGLLKGPKLPRSSRNCAQTIPCGSEKKIAFDGSVRLQFPKVFHPQLIEKPRLTFCTSVAQKGPKTKKRCTARNLL